MTPNLAAASLPQRTQNAIRRTGTDLQNEESSMGTVRPGTHSDDSTQSEHGQETREASQSHNTAPVENLAVVEDRRPGLSPDYYRFEWFRILIGMMLLMVSTVIIRVLVTFEDILWLWPLILISLAFILGSSLFYTHIFVILMEYHGPIGRYLNRHAHLRPRLQSNCLRICTYTYACGVLAAFAYLIFNFF